MKSKLGEFLWRKKRYSLWVFDLLIILCSYVVFSMIFNGIGGFKFSVGPFKYTVLISALIYSFLLFVSGSYNVVLKYCGTYEYFKVFGMGIALTVLICVAKAIPMWNTYLLSFHILVLSNLFITSALVALRFFAKYVIVRFENSKAEADAGTQTLIIGAGNAGRLMLDEIRISDQNNLKVVGFVDDNPEKKNTSVNGVRVLGNRKEIVDIVKELGIDLIIVCIPSLDQSELQKIITICSETNCKVRVLPSFDELLVSGKNFSSLKKRIRDVDITDLLERDPIKLDNDGIKAKITGKTVMVTGGGGSIGSELCRQIAKFNPKKLVVVDIYENNAYDLQNELKRIFPDLDLDVVIASVRDLKKLDVIFSEYRPDMVYHAAAHKHVPLMEFSPDEAIKNNVFGTYNTAKCADKYKVKTFTLISTDKAVNPTNVMGATKRMCEMIVQAYQRISDTEFVAVRFGNVLGSNGSVISLFKRQIAEGGPVTITHKDITRFFMTIPEASQLVLQASVFAHGGEIFVLDMGKPVKIYHLAEKLIKLSGFVPNVNMPIEVVGLRPGEKLYEELLMDEEGLKMTDNAKIFIGKPIDTDIGELHRNLDSLKEVLDCGDKMSIKCKIAEIVGTYKPDLEHV